MLRLKNICLMLIFTSLIASLNAIVNIRNFFPFGIDNGDQYLASGDDTSSSQQNLLITFPFFGYSHSSLWVNVNGAISFLAKIHTFTPSCEPVTQDYQMISPYWADVDTKSEKPSADSATSFRESTDPSDLLQAKREIVFAFPEYANLEFNWTYIVTWYNVTYFPDDPLRQVRNSFQVALTSNGIISFAIFYYNKIQWTTGDASNGENGLGGTPAQVGFDAGDGVNRFMLDISCTYDIINVNQMSNVGIPGIFVFRVDSADIETPPSITRQTYPTLLTTVTEPTTTESIDVSSILSTSPEVTTVKSFDASETMPVSSSISTKETESFTTFMTTTETTQFASTIKPFDITTITNTSMITGNATIVYSSTTSTTYIPYKQYPLTKWWIFGAVLIVFLSFATIIILYFLRKRYQQKKLEKVQEMIKIKMEMSPLQIKLTHDVRITKQMDSKIVNIDFDTILGRGSIATVYKVFIKSKIQKNINENKLKFATDENTHAAIKVPKSFDQDEVEQFVRELDALIKLGSHSHIITFIGWTLYHDVPALVTELADKNLLQYVKSFRGEILPIKTIISILWQICQALEHVASLNMVHRDVACRNILLTEGNVAKLADFGLCCHCDESFTYQATIHKRMPLKWLSIEALVDRIFSEKSDVWSFGIMCYEIFSFGAVPYATLSNEEMLEFLQAGNRLAKPNNTPDSIYSIMLDCWKMDPSDRPKFEESGNSFRILLEQETASYGYLTLNIDE